MPKPVAHIDNVPLEKIQQLTRVIREPVSYYNGRIGPRPILPGNILCFVRRRADDLMIRRFREYSQHHRFVLVVALCGTGQVCIDAKNFPLREGQAQLIFPFQFHSYLSVRPADLCWLFITFELEEGDLEILRSSTSRYLGTEELRLLTEIIGNWKENGPLQLLQLQLAAFLTRLTALKSVRPVRGIAHPGQSNAEFLSRVNRHVMAHKSGHLVLKELATVLGHSESHLRRRFRLATGLSLGRHLRELRLRRACGLLYRSSLSVGEIARECSFDSIYAFSRAFKNSWGLSPRAYRLEHVEKAGMGNAKLQGRQSR